MKLREASICSNLHGIACQTTSWVFGDMHLLKPSGIPPLSEEQAQECVRWILSDEALRTPAGRGQRQKHALTGERISRQGKQPHLRGSDRSERIGVCVSLLMWAKISNWNACLDVADLVKEKLGKSARGRAHQKDSPSRGLADVAETIRSLHKKFARSPAEGQAAIQSWFWRWWHSNYDEQHYDRFPNRRGTMSERIRDDRIRKIETLLALSQSPEESKRLHEMLEAWRLLCRGEGT
jgi:hypothetical protein